MDAEWRAALLKWETLLKKENVLSVTVCLTFFFLFFKSKWIDWLTDFERVWGEVRSLGDTHSVRPSRPVPSRRRRIISSPATSCHQQEEEQQTLKPLVERVDVSLVQSQSQSRHTVNDEKKYEATGGGRGEHSPKAHERLRLLTVHFVFLRLFKLLKTFHCHSF